MNLTAETLLVNQFDMELGTAGLTPRRRGVATRGPRRASDGLATVAASMRSYGLHRASGPALPPGRWALFLVPKRHQTRLWAPLGRLHRPSDGHRPGGEPQAARATAT